MTITYNLAPNGRWSAREATGFAAVGGSVYTYRNQTRIPKATYQDSGGTVLNTNPIILNSAGEANIYWADDEFYTIIVVDKDGFELYTQDNYPVIGGTGGGGDIIINQTFENIVLNHDFLRWGNNDFNKPAPALASYKRLSLNEITADDWFFKRNNTNATVIVSQQQFNVGQSQVPGNPINFLNYECIDVGSGAEVFKCIYQTYPSAQLFSDTEISFSIWAMSNNNDPLVIYIEQFFGTGILTSPTVTTQILSTTLTATWTQYTGQITVPSVAGKVFGTNGDDALNLCIGLPLNALADISVSRVQLNQGNELVELSTTTVWDDLLRNTQTALSPYQTGDYILSLSGAPRDGWLLCDDGTIGSSFSGSTNAGNKYLQLFLVLWQISFIYAPIQTKDGTPSSRGSSAIADFNADKRLKLTRTLGRVLGSSGSGTGLTTRNPGQFIGSESVTLSVSNLPPHQHNYQNHTASSPTANQPAFASSNINLQTLATSDGSEHGLSSTPFGIIPPTLFLNCFIKL